MPHTCHWPGCPVEVGPTLWGCPRHWYLLPRPLRARIWAAYRPGQEVTFDPSEAYLEAARDVQRWIHEYEAREPGRLPDAAPQPPGWLPGLRQ